MAELTKPCNKCGRELPATTKYFYRKANSYDGLYSYCKPCQKTSTNARRQSTAGREVANRENRARYQRSKAFPSAFAVVAALIDGRTESAQRLAKVAYLQAQKAGLL